MYKEFYLGKKHIGTLNDKVFEKEVWTSKHLFRVLNAWGIDAKTLNLLPDDVLIRIRDVEEGKVYTATVAHFKANGRYYHFKEPRADHRTQMFLERRHFQIEAPPVMSPDQKAEMNYKQSMGIV